MFAVGGLAFWLIGCVNERLGWEVALWKQMLIGSIVITALEFVSGILINVILGWQVWDYSDMPLNILGQVCPQFSLIWLIVSLAAIVVDDYLRYWIFDEEKPRYNFF